MGPLIKRSGFTLIELLVVILLIGILAGVSVSNYVKMMEIGRADRAAEVLKTLAAANRMYGLSNNSSYTFGPIGGPCACGTPGNSPCLLVGCNFMPNQDWPGNPYAFYTADPNAAANTSCWAVNGLPSRQWLACALRNTGQLYAPAPYNTWGYGLDVNGVISGVGTDIPAQAGL